MFIMQNAKLYLCKPNGVLLGAISGIKADTCKLKVVTSGLYELTFEVHKYIDENGTLVQSDYYDSIGETMELYLESERLQAFFAIDSTPSTNNDGYNETKSVTAHSIECELQHKILKAFKINCGTNDSQEYLATDTEGNPNNIDAYTGLPYEYISLVNYANPQLSLLHLALEKVGQNGWCVCEGLDEALCAKKFSFDVDGVSIYSFFMDTVAPTAGIIFEFDRKNKTVGFCNAENLGEDTGVFISMRNLLNSIDVRSSSDAGIKTKLIPKGANNLGIAYVNFGEDYITNLDHFMSTTNEYGEYKYVSQQLHDKYLAWKHYRDEERVTYEGTEYTRRKLYAHLTKLYHQTIIDIDELTNRLPNDGCSIDYKTYSLEDLETALTAYQNALAALITIYENEYKVTLGDAPDYSPIPSTGVHIKDTPYWHDFYSYNEKIIPSVMEALKLYCETDAAGNLVYDDTGNYIVLEGGNPKYSADTSIIKSVDAWIYEFGLYGLTELNNKRKAWSEAATILFKPEFVLSGTTDSPTAYRTADEAGWNSLNTKQQEQFTDYSSYVSSLNNYLDYMSFEERENAITGTICKGIIRQCEDAITDITEKINTCKALQALYQEERKKLADSVTLDNFSLDGITKVFDEADKIVLHTLMHEAEYSNENILTTSLDNIVSTVDVAEELYLDAVNALSAQSQPQYSFSVTLDNLLAIEAFKDIRDAFQVNNFIRVGTDIYDDAFVKLRLISMTYNPLIDTPEISVEFSTMTRSLEGVSDLSYFLSGNSYTSNGGSGSSMSSSSGGTFGTNDAEIQISNNMLNALLKTENFGTAVTDAIVDTLKANKGNFNTLIARSAVFDSLETGTAKIKGSCLVDKITSLNWNGTPGLVFDNTEGSVFDLTNGYFNFGGGSIVWDGETFTVNGSGTFEGTVTSAEGNIAGWNLSPSCIYKNTNIFSSPNGLYFGNNGLSIGNLFQIHSIPVINTEEEDKIDSYITNYGKIGSLNLDYGGIYTAYQTKDVSLYSGFSTGQNIDFKHPSGKFDFVSDRPVFWSGSSSIENAWDANFYVDIEGNCVAHNLFSDNIQISGGIIHLFSEEAGGKYELGSYTDDTCTLSLKYNAYDENTGLYEFNTYYLQPLGLCFNHAALLSDNEYAEITSTQESREYTSYESSGIHLNKCHGIPTDDTYCNKSVILDIEGLVLTNQLPDSQTNTSCFTTDSMIHPVTYESNISTDGVALRIDAAGKIYRDASSSNRYMTDITDSLSEELDPHALYNLNVIAYKYIGDYLHPNDTHTDNTFIGFTAEDVYEKYPIACNLDTDGNPENWEINILFPALLKLVQEQHETILALEKRITALEEINTNQ